MANVTASKDTFAAQMIALARQVLILADQMDNLNSAFSVHGFNDGGAHEFQDGDFSVNNTHLTKAIVDDTMFAIGTIDAALTTGVRNSLRECIPGGLP